MFGERAVRAGGAGDSGWLTRTRLLAADGRVQFARAQRHLRSAGDAAQVVRGRAR